MTTPPSRNPIVFVGTQRSGTTWMGSVFSEHPDLAYWSEPRQVWTMGNSYTSDDVLTSAHARPEVICKIHKKFDRFVARHGKARLVEKTPSNCLRIPFIHAVYPEAKIILVVRDGRSVLRSTQEIMQRNVPLWRIGLRAVQTPIWEWPAYVPRAFSTISRNVTGRGLQFWGPRPPGWQEWVGRDSRNVVLAKQWSATITAAVESGQGIGPDHFLQFKYEDMMLNPRAVMQQIVQFAQLEQADELVERVVRDADPARQDKWRESLDEETLEEIRPHIEPTLTRLGYTW
ncbi:MAG: sulfotransferase family protein [Phycisphaerales bacterium]